MTLDEAREEIISGIDYAAYRETDSSLHDADKNRLFGSEHYKSGRPVYEPSPWAEGDFEDKMTTLLCMANSLNRSVPVFREAQRLLEHEDSVLGRVVRRANLECPEKERELPRWVQIPAGLVLASLTLLCGYASLVLLFGVNEKNPVLAAVIGFGLLLGCLWVLEKCFRLLTGRRVRGGLLSPRALRMVSFFFLIFPVAGVFTGYYRKMGTVAVFQALMYLSSFVGLQSLARRREVGERRIASRS